MHVVLSGYYGFDNVGDEAILLSIIRELKEVDPNIEITVLSNNPDATKQTYGVHAVNRWSMKEINHVLKEADGLISGGGSLLQDETGLKSIPYYTGVMRLAMRQKKPVFIYAQGMGPINKGISKFLTRSTLNKVDKITVRDKESEQLLKNIGVQKEISLVPDPVMGLGGQAFTNQWLNRDPASNKPVITVSVRDWPSNFDFKKIIADALDKLVQSGSGSEIVFLPMHGGHDEKSSEDVVALMKEKSKIAPSTLPIEEKISIIGESNLLIGMRLHSLIFAAITHTPFIALSYDPKIDSFASIAGQPVAGHVEKDDWDGEQLAKLVQQALEHEESTRSSLKTLAMDLKNQAQVTAKMALETFTKAK